MFLENDVLFAPIDCHVLQKPVSWAIAGVGERNGRAPWISNLLAAVVTTRTKGHALFLGEVVLVFGIVAVNDAHLERMAPDDLGIVILPGEEIFPVAPWREAPNSWQAAAVDPHRGIIRHIPRRREKCWNQPVESLRRRGICLGDIDPIGRVRELKIVHGGGPKNLAQLGHRNAAWLAPRLLDIGSSGISPPAGIAHGGRSEIPRVVGIFQH